jgi:hypothetical protein
MTLLGVDGGFTVLAGSDASLAVSFCGREPCPVYVAGLR